MATRCSRMACDQRADVRRSTEFVHGLSFTGNRPSVVSSTTRPAAICRNDTSIALRMNDGARPGGPATIPLQKQDPRHARLHRVCIEGPSLSRQANHQSCRRNKSVLHSKTEDSLRSVAPAISKSKSIGALSHILAARSNGRSGLVNQSG